MVRMDLSPVTVAMEEAAIIVVVMGITITTEMLRNWGRIVSTTLMKLVDF